MFSQYKKSNRISQSFRNAASRMPVPRRKVSMMRRVGNRNLAIGLGAGIAAGIAAGMLMAPQKGKEIRHHIAKGTREFFGDMRTTGRQLGTRGSRLWLAGKRSAEGAKEAAIESAERH